MPRVNRHDEDQRLHHVTNRGLARRTIFETGADVEFLFRCIQHAVLEGWIEVLAYTVLTTHFHLLVRSLDGQLSRAMHWIQMEFVKRFNRSRERDGPLMKNRFFSRPVLSETYFRAVIRYIDQNPVTAGLVDRALEYPHGSARWYSEYGGPRWLSRRTVEDLVTGTCGTQYRPETYVRILDRPLTFGLQKLVELRLERPASPIDSLDNLVTAAPTQVRAWFEHNAANADGVRPLEIVVSPETLESTLAQSGPPGRALAAGLLRVGCGLSSIEIGQRLRCSTSTAQRLLQAHRKAMDDASYADRAAKHMLTALRREHDEHAPG